MDDGDGHLTTSVARSWASSALCLQTEETAPSRPYNTRTGLGGASRGADMAEARTVSGRGRRREAAQPGIAEQVRHSREAIRQYSAATTTSGGRARTESGLRTCGRPVKRPVISGRPSLPVRSDWIALGRRFERLLTDLIPVDLVFHTLR